MPDPIVETKSQVESSFPKKGTAVVEFTCPPYIKEAKAGQAVDQPKDMPQESWEGLFPNYLKKDA